MEKNIITLSKWLVTKDIKSLLKIQKLLFFIRVEELKNNDLIGTYFKNDENFQAWIYGPVSKESFNFLQPWFNQQSELESYLLNKDEEKEIDQKYLKYLEKYKNLTPSELVRESHKNLSWQKARDGVDANEICTKFMKEDEDFIKFS